MRAFFYTLFLFSCLVLCLPAYAQDQPSLTGLGIENNEMVGKVFKHTPKFRLPIPEMSTAYEVNLVFKTYGTKEWQQRRRFPVLGLGFTYTDYGMDTVYGKCLGVYPNFQIPLIMGKRLEWTLRMGFGLGYATKRFERTPTIDTLNNAIGSHINNFTLFVTDLRYHLSQHWDLQLGANFSHMSNAAFRQPNLGINMYGAHVGFRYFPQSSNPRHILHDLKPLRNRWLLHARVSMAIDGYAAPGGPDFPVYLADVYASRRWLSKNKMFAGVDYSYHTSVYAFLRNNEIVPGKEAQNSYKCALFGGNEFMLGRVGLILQLGYYLKNAYLHPPPPYYEKIGAQFYLIRNEHGLTKELFLLALLKVHQTEAELVQFGLGAGF